MPEASNNLDAMDLREAYETGGHFPRSQRERQLVLIRQLGYRELYTATAGEAAQQMAVHARKLVGYAARVATGIARIAIIHTKTSE